MFARQGILILSLISGITAGIPDVNKENSKSCCQTIRISSTGGAVGNQIGSLGIYNEYQEYQDKTTYQLQNGKKMIYFKIGHKLWVVGQNFTKEMLRSKSVETEMCPNDVKSWEFYNENKKVWEADRTLSLVCLVGSQGMIIIIKTCWYYHVFYDREKL